MSEQLRRALGDAASGQPRVDDWLGPVRRGVRARRRRRAAQSAAAGTALAVAAVLGVTALTGPARPTSLEQADPTASPRPTPGADRPTTPPPVAVLPTRPAAQPGRRPTDPALGLDRDVTGPVISAPLPSARPSARPTATPRPSSSPRPSPTTSAPEPAPTAGTQRVVVEIAPAGTQYPAGPSRVTVTATGDGDAPPRVLSLRVDGEPLSADPLLDCAYPTSPPGRSSHTATRVFDVDLSPGEHLLEAVADSGCSYYRGRGRTSRTVTTS